MHKIYKMSFSKVYPHYITKVVKKGRSQKELDDLIYWLTGYDKEGLQYVLDNEIDFETFLKKRPI